MGPKTVLDRKLNGSDATRVPMSPCLALYPNKPDDSRMLPAPKVAAGAAKNKVVTKRRRICVCNEVLAMPLNGWDRSTSNIRTSGVTTVDVRWKDINQRDNSTSRLFRIETVSS